MQVKLHRNATTTPAVRGLIQRSSAPTAELARRFEPSNPRIIADLRNLAAGLKSTLARGALMDSGGAPKKAALDRLVQGLARVFENATGRLAGLTDSRHAHPPRYEDRFWDLVEMHPTDRY